MGRERPARVPEDRLRGMADDDNEEVCCGGSASELGPASDASGMANAMRFKDVDKKSTDMRLDGWMDGERDVVQLKSSKHLTQRFLTADASG